MVVDPKQLRRQAKRLQKARRRRNGRGTTAAIRAALPTIYKLRSDGVLWREIAEALGKQGMVQGSGKRRIPITTSRLTALVRQIEVQNQEERQRLKTPSIKSRQVKGMTALKLPAVSLAVELRPEIETSERRSTPPSEDDLRRAALDKIQDVLKKD
jgi:hypothetical protein